MDSTGHGDRPGRVEESRFLHPLIFSLMGSHGNLRTPPRGYSDRA